MERRPCEGAAPDGGFLIHRIRAIAGVASVVPPPGSMVRKAVRRLPALVRGKTAVERGARRAAASRRDNPRSQFRILNLRAHSHQLRRRQEGALCRRLDLISPLAAQPADLVLGVGRQMVAMTCGTISSE